MCCVVCLFFFKQKTAYEMRISDWISAVGSSVLVMNIPSGVCCPGAELVWRAGDAAPSPDTTIVVNCAGRTRSIIGAQSLINAGFPNRVVALRNGTMGWHLAGLKLEHGNRRHAPERKSGG